MKVFFCEVIGMWQVKLHEDKPIYLSVSDHVEQLILSQSLSPHDPLPSIRQLSEWIDVNKDTVVAAYRHLESRGYVYKIPGKGTFVKDFGEVEIEQFEPQAASCRYDFTQSIISTDYFPVEEFKIAFDEVLTRDRGMAFLYHDPMGYEPLRRAIHEQLAAGGIEVPLDSVMIISGAQQGIDIVSRQLLGKQDHVFIENPTYRGAYQYFKALGARITGIPYREADLDREHLARELQWNQPKLFYTMPNFQNPTGFSYSESTKLELLEMARAHDFYIIEDDYTNEINYGREVRSLKSYDRDDRVIYIKSFSKILMPGLRVSYIVMPQKLTDALENIKVMTDLSTSGILQRMLAQFINSAHYRHHIDRINAIFRERMELTDHCLKRYLPESVHYRQPEGGLSFWIQLPQGVDAETLLEESRKSDLVFSIGTDFFIDRQIRGLSYVRLSIGGIHPDRIEEGIKLFSRTVLKCLSLNKNKMIIY